VVVTTMDTRSRPRARLLDVCGAARGALLSVSAHLVEAAGAGFHDRTDFRREGRGERRGGRRDQPDQRRGRPALAVLVPVGGQPQDLLPVRGQSASRALSSSVRSGAVVRKVPSTSVRVSRQDWTTCSSSASVGSWTRCRSSRTIASGRSLAMRRNSAATASNRRWRSSPFGRCDRPRSGTCRSTWRDIRRSSVAASPRTSASALGSLAEKRWSNNSANGW
jgi:hypothetical protein